LTIFEEKFILKINRFESFAYFLNHKSKALYGFEISQFLKPDAYLIRPLCFVDEGY
jgi:hypothetical protein